MKVTTDNIDVDMDIRKNGVEFQVYENDADHRGDFVVTSSGLIWREGKKRKKIGVKISWDDFIDFVNHRRG